MTSGLRRMRVLALPLGALLMLMLGAVMARLGVAPSGPGGAGGLEALGRLLFTDYLLPFELTSVLLLAAMVGVLLLARRKA